MPMPGQAQKGAGYQKMDSADFPAFGQPAGGANQKMVYQAKKPKHNELDNSDSATDMGLTTASEDSKGPHQQHHSKKNQQKMPMRPFFTNAVQMNLCQEHFPEPIMMIQDKPLCKKCIQEQFAFQKQRMNKMTHTQQAMTNVNFLGLANRPLQEFQSEKQKITRSI